MRRISRSWPPKVNVRPEGQREATLEEAERGFLSALEEVGESADRSRVARGTFDDLRTQALRDHMSRLQGHLCVYCERAIREAATRIDHWRPLSLNPPLALAWKNLYLSCASPDTCDCAKSDRPLKWLENDPDLPWPCDYPYENVVGFSSGGDIFVRPNVGLDDAMQNALSVALDDHTVGTLRQLSILRLNSATLVAARKAALDRQKAQLEKRFQSRHASREDRDHLAQELLESDPLPQFVSIRVAYLRKTLGRGK